MFFPIPLPIPFPVMRRQPSAPNNNGSVCVLDGKLRDKLMRKGWHCLDSDAPHDGTIIEFLDPNPFDQGPSRLIKYLDGSELGNDPDIGPFPILPGWYDWDSDSSGIWNPYGMLWRPFNGDPKTFVPFQP